MKISERYIKRYIKFGRLIENVQKILNIIFENISAKCVLGEIKSDSPKCSLKDYF